MSDARTTPIIPLALVGIGLLLTALVAVHLMVRGLADHPVPPIWEELVDGDPARGREAIVAYGCGSCHAIPGIRAAQGRVGPELNRFSEQIYIAGRLPNTPLNLIHWIQNPHDVDPLNAMPDLGVSHEDARDIAAYLYTLR